MNRSRVSDILTNLNVFRTVYVTLLFFTLILFLNIPAAGVVIVMFCTLAPYVLYKNFIKNNRFTKIPFYRILLFFTICTILTLLTNVVSNFFYSFGMILHNTFCFTIFYGMCASETYEDNKKEMYKIFRIIVILTTVTSLIGLVIVLFKSTLSFSVYSLNSPLILKCFKLINPDPANEYMRIGFLDDRFVGIFSNSNLQGFCNAISFVFANMICSQRKLHILPAWFLTVSFIVNGVSLLLTDSNASLLFVIIYFTMLWFYKLILLSDSSVVNKGKLLSVDLVRRMVIWVLACCIMAAFSLKARDIFQELTANCLSYFQNKKIIENLIIDNSINNPVIKENVKENNKYSTETGKDDIQTEIKIGRQSHDVSSGRFILWKQALSIFKNHPIFGIARGNLIYYGNKYLQNGILYYDLHNGYLTILVCYGLVGFLSFALFGILVLLRLSGKLIRCAKLNSNSIFPYLFSTVIAFCVHSLFEKSMLSEPSFMCILFWLVLGYTINYINLNETEEISMEE